MIEKRQYERKSLEIDAEYDWCGCKCPCFIVDISLQGVGIRVRGCLTVGDNIILIIGTEKIPACIVRVDGSFVGVKFGRITDNQMNYFLELKKKLV